MRDNEISGAQTCTAAQPLEILLVEDNPADVRMTREALAAVRISHRLHVVDNGEGALDFIRRTGSYQGVPKPDLVLLDLSLPRMGGHDVLERLRNIREADWFPVVILTGSRNEQAVAKSFVLEADEHICKPATLRELAAELQLAISLAGHRDA